MRRDARYFLTAAPRGRDGRAICSRRAGLRLARPARIAGREGFGAEGVGSRPGHARDPVIG
jgi:hypothetical protein